MVVAEEEEASAAACAFSRLENLVPVELWAETALDQVYVAEVLCKDSLEHSVLVGRHLDLLVKCLVHGLCLLLQ